MTTTYAYDGDGKRTSTTAGATTTRSTYDINTSLPVLLDDGSRKYVWGANGLAYAVDGSGAITVYHGDGLGSARALSDPSGAVVQTYQTDEFGILVAGGAQGTQTQRSATRANSAMRRAGSATCGRACMTRRSGGSCSAIRSRDR